MPHTGLKCLNANFIHYATQLLRGHFFKILIFNFVLTFYTYKLLQAFSPKASVENSSAQWAISFFNYANSPISTIICYRWLLLLLLLESLIGWPSCWNNRLQRYLHHHRKLPICTRDDNPCLTKWKPLFQTYSLEKEYNMILTVTHFWTLKEQTVWS